MKQLEPLIDQKTLRPCQAYVQGAWMAVKVAVKFGYHHLEVVRYFTLDPSEE